MYVNIVFLKHILLNIINLFPKKKNIYQFKILITLSKLSFHSNAILTAI